MRAERSRATMMNGSTTTTGNSSDASKQASTAGSAEKKGWGYSHRDDEKANLSRVLLIGKRRDQPAPRSQLAAD
jgi:hypothetical protein